MISFRILCACWLWCAAGIAYGTCIDNLPMEAPDDRYRLDGESVIDQYTGLVWQRCALGQTWSAEKNRCQLNLNLQRLFTWPEAISEAQASTLGGYDDWRLPNKNELNSIVDRACTGPAVNETAFPDTTLAAFWTSTPARHTSNYAWQVDFSVGTLVAYDMSTRFSVRLVRQP